MVHVRFFVGNLGAWFGIQKHSYLIADVQWIRALITTNCVCNCFAVNTMLVRQITVKEHAFTLTVAQVFVKLQAVIIRIMLEFNKWFSQLESIFHAIYILTRLKRIFGISLAKVGKTAIQRSGIIGHSPKIHAGIILPVG